MSEIISCPYYKSFTASGFKNEWQRQFASWKEPPAKGFFRCKRGGLVKYYARANHISAFEAFMLDLKFIRENADLMRQSMLRRHQEPSLIDEVISLDDERKRLILESESRKSERNTVSKQISQLKDPAERQEKIKAMRALGDEIAGIEPLLKETEAKLRLLQASIPQHPRPGCAGWKR